MPTSPRSAARAAAVLAVCLPLSGGVAWLGSSGGMVVSGVPLPAKRGLEKWGEDPAYAAYLARTRLLVPLPR